MRKMINTINKYFGQYFWMIYLPFSDLFSAMHFPFEQLQYGLFWSVLLASVLLCKFTCLTVPNFLGHIQIFCTNFPDFELSAISIF